MNAIRKAIGLVVLGTLPAFVAAPVMEQGRNLAADLLIVEHDRSLADNQIVNHDRLGEAPTGYGSEVRG